MGSGFVLLWQPPGMVRDIAHNSQGRDALLVCQAECQRLEEGSGQLVCAKGVCVWQLGSGSCRRRTCKVACQFEPHMHMSPLPVATTGGPFHTLANGDCLGQVRSS